MINEKIDPRLKKFLIPRLRRAWLMWPPRQNAIKAARVERGSYKCNICKQIGFKRQQLHVDHIEPAQNIETSLSTWYDLIMFIIRLFVYEDSIQAICISCHDLKTHTEDQMRKFYKDQKKVAKKVDKRKKKC